MDNNGSRNIHKKIIANTNSVEIIAVTKTRPFKTVLDAYAKGYRHFGENRVEEAIAKIELARQNNLNDICWHMIGHVQSRRVRDVVDHFDRVDSVDSIELLEKLNYEAQKQNKKLHILIEVNISGEEGKYGFRDIDALTLRRIDANHICIDGLMTMAPYVTNPEDNRVHFRALKDLSIRLGEQNPHIGPVLSMGTSCDYKVAIEEGATEIRLGESLFGKRLV